MTKRFHVADNDEIEELLLNKDSLNTKTKVQQFQFKFFRQFLEEGGRENTKFEEYELSELDAALRSFYAGARKSDGSLFKKSAIQNVKYGLKRYLNEKRNIDINKDNEFTKSNLIFQAVKVDLKRKGYAKVDHYPGISEEDLQKLYSGDTPVFDVNTPYGLQFKVWFEYILFLCRRGQENLRTMTKDTFRVKKDASCMKYIYKNKDELDKNQDLWQRPKASFDVGESTWYCKIVYDIYQPFH
ncbi:KCTD1_15 [Mytilus coruscus]|uniref:KCTD1_15 n=1 Tax=Mytilus coruscus TaxID=42192 RepID=A0A6J8CY10_MYTCO|nr:KCTD1_15 [Mytilus coruscus]